jgi:hypothetical protein
MSENFRQLIQEHRPFHEVLPYNVVIEDAHGKAACSTRRIQAGFDIDIYGLKTSDGPGLSADYGQAYGILRKTVEEISRHTTNSCSIEVISFSSTVFLDAREGLRPEAMLRIRCARSILHRHFTATGNPKLSTSAALFASGHSSSFRCRSRTPPDSVLLTSAGHNVYVTL